MFVLALDVELRLAGCTSLKDKRGALRPVIDGLRHRHNVSVAETGHQDQWQRSRLGVAVVSSHPEHGEEVMDSVERLIWSRPDVEVVQSSRHWMDID